MTGIWLFSATCTASWIAVICGTPTPEITRVVQIEPGPMPDFHRVGAGRDQILAPVGRGHVAGHDVDVPLLLYAPNGFNNVGRVPVSTVDHQHVDALANQGFDSLVIVNSDGGTDSQPSLPIFAGLRKSPHHINVFDGNQSSQPQIFVNQQKLLHLFCH